MRALRHTPRRRSRAGEARAALTHRPVSRFVCLAAVNAEGNLADREDELQRPIDHAEPIVCILIDGAQDAGSPELERSASQRPSIVAVILVEELDGANPSSFNDPLDCELAIEPDISPKKMSDVLKVCFERS